MLDAHVLIGFYDKVKRKPQQYWAVQFQIAPVIIGMEGLVSYWIPKSCLLLSVTSLCTQSPNSGFIPLPGL